MSLVPEPLPNRRPISYGVSFEHVQPVSRRVRRREDAIAADLALHELDTLRRSVKAQREIRAAVEVVNLITEAQFGFYDRNLHKAGPSVVKQELLAENIDRVRVLHEDIFNRFRR